MNDATLPVFASLLLGVVAGPLVWWLGREVLRFVAWHLEYGKAWLPDLADQEFHCPACAKTFAMDEAACSGCGKSREVAYYASLREVDIAAEQVLRLSRMGALDAETAKRMEEGLLRQRDALARMRKPQKSGIGKVELILPGGEKAEGGYIHPETFHESKHPGKHPLRLKPVMVTDEDELPSSGLAVFARLAGWFLLVAGIACWLHGAFPVGASKFQIPGLAESWTGLALLLAGMYSLAFGRASGVLAHLASFGTGILVPAFWVVGPWLHGMEIAPGDWAIGLACAALGACGGAIIDRYLAQWRGEFWDEGNTPPEPTVSEGRLMSFSGLALGLLQLGALAGLARPDGWFAPWGAVIGSAWGLVALCGFQMGRLVLSGMGPDFRLPQWLFECAFGALIAISAGVGVTHSVLGVTALSAGMSLLAFAGMFFACGPTSSWLGLLKPEADKNAPLVLRAAILGGAGALACAPAMDPHPWIGVASAFLGALSLLALGAELRQRSFLIVGLGLISLAGGLGAHQALKELHHSVLEQTWMAIDGALLGVALGAGIARVLERLVQPQTSLVGSATLWMRLFSVQALVASAVASIGLALAHKNLAEVHEWTNPVTGLAWATTLVLVAQVRVLRGHGFGLLAISGSVILAGILDKGTGRTVLALQAGLLAKGCSGLLLAMGVGRIRPLSRRLSKVSISWAMALLGIHVIGVLAIVFGRKAGWEALALPSVVGGATWMMISRNRNLPGLGWVALGWMTAGVLPYASRMSSFSDKVPPLLAMALIGLFLWWWIAPARILRRAQPVGPMFAILVGALALVAAIASRPLDPLAGTFVGLSVILLALVPRVWESSRMLGLVAVAFASLTLLLGRDFAAITGRKGPEVWTLALGLFVVGAALMVHVGRYFSRWLACQSWSIAAVAGLVIAAAVAACVVAPLAMIQEQSRLGLGLLTATPFAVVLALVSLTNILPKSAGQELRLAPEAGEGQIGYTSKGLGRQILGSLSFCLGFIAWSNLGVLAYCLVGANHPIFSMTIMGLLWTMAFALMDPIGIIGRVFGVTNLRTRKILFGLAGTGATLSLVGVLGISQGESPLEQLSYALGVVSALGLAGCLFWRSRDMARIPVGMTRLELLWINRRNQEGHGHAIWLVLALGAGLLWRTVGSLDEIPNPIICTMGFWGLCAAAIALLRGGDLRWIARPGALQAVGTLGLVAITLLGVTLYENIGKELLPDQGELQFLKAGSHFGSGGSFSQMALVSGIVWCLICVYLDRVRPGTPHPGEPGSDWGLNVGSQTPFALSFWVASGVSLVAFLCHEGVIGPDTAYMGLLGLIPPVFGMLAQKSSQPNFATGGSGSESFPSQGDTQFGDDDFEFRRVA